MCISVKMCVIEIEYVFAYGCICVSESASYCAHMGMCVCVHSEWVSECVCDCVRRRLLAVCKFKNVRVCNQNICFGELYADRDGKGTMGRLCILSTTVRRALLEKHTIALPCWSQYPSRPCTELQTEQFQTGCSNPVQKWRLGGSFPTQPGGQDRESGDLTHHLWALSSNLWINSLQQSRLTYSSFLYLSAMQERNGNWRETF